MLPFKKPSTKQPTACIAVMGCTGAGKTTFINVASASDLRVGVGLESCTETIQMSKPFELDGVEVTLVDTPGFDDTNKSDGEILNIVCDFLSSEHQHGRKLQGVIYLHRISDNRMAGSATRNLRFFAQLCGDEALGNCAITTNMWSLVSPQVGGEREQELKSKDNFFKPMLSQGASLFRHDNTIESAHKVIQHLLHKTPMVLAIQRELVDEKKRVFETKAGAALLGEIAELEKKHQEELRKLDEEMAEVMEQHDEEARLEIEEAKRELFEQQKKLEEEKAKIRNASITTTEPQPLPQEGGRIAKIWRSFRRFFRRFVPCLPSDDSAV